LHCGQCGMKFTFSCPKCGAANTTGAVYCVKCGTDVQGEIKRQQEELERRRAEEAERQKKEAEKKARRARKTKIGLAGCSIFVAVVLVFIGVVFYLTELSPSARAQQATHDAQRLTYLQTDAAGYYPELWANEDHTIVVYIHTPCIYTFDDGSQDLFVRVEYVNYHGTNQPRTNLEITESYFVDNLGNQYIPSDPYMDSPDTDELGYTAIDGRFQLPDFPFGPDRTSLTIHLLPGMDEYSDITIQFSITDLRDCSG